MPFARVLTKLLATSDDKQIEKAESSEKKIKRVAATTKKDRSRGWRRRRRKIDRTDGSERSIARMVSTTQKMNRADGVDDA